IARIPPGTYLRVKVRRGNEREVILYFAGASGTGAVFAQRGYVKITNQFAIEIQKNLLTLPSDQLTDADRSQIEKILGVAECTEEEYAMLSDRLNGAKVSSGAVTARGEDLARQIQRLLRFLPNAVVPEAILMK